MPSLGKYLILAGLALAALGVIVQVAASRGWLRWLGRLPGDIHVQGAHGSFHFPVVTCIVVSIILSLLLAVARRFFS